MFGKQHRLCLSLVLLVAACADNRLQTTTEVQNMRMDETLASSRPQLVYMVDNAILHDMSIADIHFVPHTDELSGTGVARLDRLAVLLDSYGGTVRYDTGLHDDDLIEQRIEHVREYLAMTGCDTDRFTVAAQLSGGRGMPATDAIEDKATAFKKKSGGMSTATGSSMVP